MSIYLTKQLKNSALFHNYLLIALLGFMETSKYLTSQTFDITICQLIQLQKVFTNQRKIKIYDQMKYQRLVVIAKIINMENFLTLSDETAIMYTVIPNKWMNSINLQINKYYRFIFSTQNSVRIQDITYNISIKGIQSILDQNQITEHLSKVILQKQQRIMYKLQRSHIQIQQQGKQQKGKRNQQTKAILIDWCKQINHFDQVQILKAFKHLQSNQQIMQIINGLCEDGVLMNCGTGYQWLGGFD